MIWSNHCATHRILCIKWTQLFPIHHWHLTPDHLDKSNIPLLVTLHIKDAKTWSGWLRMSTAALLQLIQLLTGRRQEAAATKRWTQGKVTNSFTKRRPQLFFFLLFSPFPYFTIFSFSFVHRSSKSLLANVLDIDDDFRCNHRCASATLPHQTSYYRPMYR